MYTLIHIIGWALIALAVFVFIFGHIVGTSDSSGESIIGFVSDVISLYSVTMLASIIGGIGIACLLAGIAP
jgi:hypothetical protein